MSLDPAVATLLDLALLLARLSFLAVGGSTTVLGDLRREVLARGWMDADQFAEAYALSQFVPGPGALYVLPIGYHAAGWTGAVVACVAFFLPTACLMLAVAQVWRRVRTSPWPAACRDAILPVALGVVVAASWNVGSGLVRDLPTGLIFAASTAILVRTRAPALLPLLGGAACGAVFLQP